MFYSPQQVLPIKLHEKQSDPYNLNYPNKLLKTHTNSSSTNSHSVVLNTIKPIFKLPNSIRIEPTRSQPALLPTLSSTTLPKNTKSKTHITKIYFTKYNLTKSQELNKSLRDMQKEIMGMVLKKIVQETKVDKEV